MKPAKPKLRHIAISVPDIARAQKFFEEAFGMEKVGNAGRGVYMSDGTINVALLDYQGTAPTGKEGPHLGLLHFGMWVDNLAEAEAQVKAAGGKHLHGRPPDRPNTFYEVKYADPDGVVFDLTESGWKGAQKDVVPAELAKA